MFTSGKYNVSLAKVREHLSYDPESGHLHWVSRRGARAGSLHQSGYRRVTVFGNGYYEHVLIWFYVYGVWPTHEIDHVNSDRADNRIANLRDVTRSQNMQNKLVSERNAAGLKGVYFDRNAGKWQAAIQVRGKRQYLGLFTSAEEAYAAYCDKAAEIHTHNKAINQTPSAKLRESTM